MKKAAGDRKTVHKHSDLTVEHQNDSDETGARHKHVQQPISDIIAKFHKIKEERFKPKVKNHFQNIKTPDPQSRADNVDPNQTSQKLEPLVEQRPKSASENTQEDDTDNIRGRRMSLPSLFHPLTPLPIKSESQENIERGEEEVKGMNCRRRHSVSHVMTEYSKHNLHHLSRIQEMKINELNDATEHKKEMRKPKAKPKPKWLTGDDIHAFYNMWENSRKLTLKKKHLRKVLPRTESVANHKDDVDGDYQRPRVSSF